ncbi:MAG: DapH/DapD/GlmU-related protein [Anaerovoracaceae bacterium]|nr:DapH/DapD/GlmU-related protein [Anaerovoracaceae bacterium]
MRISELMEKYKIVDSYKIDNEKNFDTLGLTESIIDVPYCTFIDDEKYSDNLSEYITMVLTTEELAEKVLGINRGVCIVDNPRNTFFKLHNALGKSNDYMRESFDTVIGRNCNISKMAVIAEKNVIIGDNVTIEEFVVIRENTIIKDNCIIRAGVKIGSVDFEFKRENNTIFGVDHYGGVIIENNVEIQCNSVINRGLYPWDDTFIGAFTKIDAEVLISHGVKIGKCSMIVGHSILGGRTVIGENCWIGISSMIRNGLNIGDNARVNMGAVVTKSVKEGETVTGNFAIRHDKFISNMKKSLK